MDHHGALLLKCEIDAKGAGVIGFLRAWAGPASTDPDLVLRTFMQDERSIAGYRTRPLTVAAAPAEEAVMLIGKGEFQRPQRLLAVVSPKGSVVLVAGGLDAEEHRGLLTGYELAKKTLTVS